MSGSVLSSFVAGVSASGADWRVPLHLGRLANVDEVYAIFQDLGLLQEEVRKKGNQSGGSLCPMSDG
jgi:hypothetical protein